MTPELVNMGIDVVGNMPWGTHFCHFYETRQDLLDIVVPYLNAGLENREACLWVVAGAFDRNAESALRRRIAYFDEQVAAKNIEVLLYSEVFLEDHIFDQQRILEKLNARLAQAIDEGHSGFRLAADGAWIGRRYWKAFSQFERAINLRMAEKRMVALCAYPIASNGASAIFDVVRTHHFAIARRQGRWEALETPESIRSKAEIQKLNEVLEQRITARTRQLADANQALQREILERDKLANQLNQAQKMESIGRLAGGVAHDFNNMLGVIIGHAELGMEWVGPDSPVHIDFDAIRKAALRSADLTRQLLAFARKQAVSPTVIDLNDQVSGTLKILRRLLGEEIELLFKPAANLWPVKLDPVQLDQLLANLCVNARDAISGGGTITLATANIVLDDAFCQENAGATPGKNVVLTVSDDGSGMDQETMERIFDPFFTTKEYGSGTGLGLSTVYGIVKQHEGYIAVDSQPGQGATFAIYFPRTHEIVQTREEDFIEATAKGTETVLLVEDENSILRLGKTVLEQIGYKVLTARSGDEALDVAAGHEGPIHLLVTDVVMPKMNGLQLKKRIERERPDIKVLFISGYTADIVSQRGILPSGTQFLQKPFSNKALAEKVRAVMENTR